MTLFSRNKTSESASNLDSPEGIIESLLSNKKSTQAKALDLILHFEKEEKLSLKDQIAILRNCGSAPDKLLTKIIQQHLMSAHQGIQDACLELLQESLSRPGRKIIIADLMERDEPAMLLAIKLSHQWNSRVYI